MHEEICCIAGQAPMRRPRPSSAPRARQRWRPWFAPWATPVPCSARAEGVPRRLGASPAPASAEGGGEVAVAGCVPPPLPRPRRGRRELTAPLLLRTRRAWPPHAPPSPKLAASGCPAPLLHPELATPGRRAEMGWWLFCCVLEQRENRGRWSSGRRVGWIHRQTAVH